MNWHYFDQGHQVGPVTDAQLLKEVQDGRINADTLVWHEGLAEWKAFREVETTLPRPTPAPPPVAVSLNAGEVICAECGKVFPAAETIQYGKARVCSGCKPVFLQKLAEGALINTGELQYAGFGIRLGAKILDSLILGVPFMIIFFIALMPTISYDAANRRAGQQVQTVQFLPLFIQLGFIFVHFAYQVFFLGKFGATPGKMLCKLRVVTAEGGRFGYARAAGRALAEMLSGLICYIGYFLVLFDGEKRALHDHICNTRVVHKIS